MFLTWDQKKKKNAAKEQLLLSAKIPSYKIDF